MNEHVYADKKVGKYTVQVLQDFDPMSPEDWEQDAILACFHNRYVIGPDHGYSIDEVKRIAKDEKNYFSLPVYAYIHSGITISTGSFSCPWDSGQVGIVFIEKSKVREIFGIKRISPKIKQRAFNLLKGTVEDWDNFLTGDVYGFVVKDENDEVIDSCWGFYGDTDYALQEGIAIAEYLEAQELKQHINKVKQWIANKVPVIYREACPV